MQRRTFCLDACQAVSIGALVDACGGSPTSPSGTTSAAGLAGLNGTVAAGAITVPIVDGSALAAVGGAALLQTSAGTFLVVRTAQDAFNAMTAVCTHEGCTITGFASQNFVCPCHGSRFNQQGTVVTGPALRALQRFTTSFSNNVLTIAL